MNLSKINNNLPPLSSLILEWIINSLSMLTRETICQSSNIAEISNNKDVFENW